MHPSKRFVGIAQPSENATSVITRLSSKYIEDGSILAENDTVFINYDSAAYIPNDMRRVG